MHTNQVIYSEDITRTDGRKLLANIYENGFSRSIRELAVALGRAPDEIQDILNYDEEVDEDLLVKIHGIAQEFDLEEE